MTMGRGIVAAQILAIAGVLWPQQPWWDLAGWLDALAILFGLAGAGFALWGLAPHGRRITPSVSPPAGMPLIVSGAYRYSRNPIYAGLIVGALGFAVHRAHPVSGLCWVALFIVLRVKVAMEEERLRARFGSAYDRYAARTRRLL